MKYHEYWDESPVLLVFSSVFPDINHQLSVTHGDSYGSCVCFYCWKRLSWAEQLNEVCSWCPSLGAGPAGTNPSGKPNRETVATPRSNHGFVPRCSNEPVISAIQKKNRGVTFKFNTSLMQLSKDSTCLDNVYIWLWVKTLYLWWTSRGMFTHATHFFGCGIDRWQDFNNLM